MFQWVRIGGAVPAVTIGNPKKNAEEICTIIKQTKEVALLVFPQLSVTGNTCGDLFFQAALQKASLEAIQTITRQTKTFDGIVVIGAPVSINDRLYNCSLVIAQGNVMGVIPKTFIPHSEARWFGSALELDNNLLSPATLGLSQEEWIPVGNHLVFDAGAFRFGVELGEDGLSPLSPGTQLALNGADVIVNPTFQKAFVSTQETACQRSLDNLCTYLQVSSGKGESTTDFVAASKVSVFETGVPLACSDSLTLVDTDIETIRLKRQKSSLFHQAKAMAQDCLTDSLPEAKTSDGSLYPLSKTPFLAQQPEKRRADCLELFQIQAQGLCKRLEVTGGNMVIGVSGGLDSTLALLVCAYAAKKMNLPQTAVLGITMPCFGTTDRTYQNALQLMNALGISSMEIPVKASVVQHFKDIGHDMTQKDTTYENSQARERTQVLMDVANRHNAIVVGTGDLSELALGWCTYNGDHMSMYGVNASVPKTSIYWVIESIIDANLFPEANATLADILDTPISPELLPPNEDGSIAQKTEDLVGSYELHDFFLYYILKFGFSPAKIYTLACRAFEQDYSKETVLKWLKACYRRFFSQQFKRNCMPDGVKVSPISLSPRGDWQMPSDAVATIWLEELEQL